MKKIFAFFLALLLLLASVSFSEELLPVDLTEGSRLIGLLITREALTAYTGASGVLPASPLQMEPDGDPEYIFGDIPGLCLICFILPDVSGESSRIVSSVDDGFTAVDFDVDEGSGSVSMDAAVSFVPGQEETFFFCNPVLLALSGQVFAVPGDCMTVSAAMNPPGSEVGQTIRDERKHTENGTEVTDTTAIAIRISAVREPVEIRLLQFSEKHELLKSEAFLPGAVPERIVPLGETDYLLLETVERDQDGTFLIRREVIGRDGDFLNTLSCREDGLCVCHYHDVLWTQQNR